MNAHSSTYNNGALWRTTDDVSVGWKFLCQILQERALLDTLATVQNKQFENRIIILQNLLSLSISVFKGNACRLVRG